MATTTIPANAILFAINSAIRLGTRFRKAYARKLQGKVMVLPLPSSDNSANETDISEFFDSRRGRRFLNLPESKRLKELHEKAVTTVLDGEELEAYRSFYDVFFDLDNQKGAFNLEEFHDEIAEMLHLKQWQNDKALHPSPLQLVAGSIIEFGIDYFNQFPGALNVHSAHGKAIKHFLSALDTIDFAEDVHLRKAINRRLVPELFAAAAETLNDLAPEIVGDEQLQNLIQAATQGVYKDIYNRLNPGMTRTEKEEVINWGKMVLHSLIKNAGEYTFMNTKSLFGTNEAASKLVANTGNALLNAILSNDEVQINLKEVFTLDTLDEIVREAFSTIAEYPQLISKEEGIKNIIVGVSNTMANSGIDRPGLIPEFIRLIIEKAALNVHFFWEDGDDVQGPKNLLIIALRETLSVIAHKENPDDVWRLSLSNSQLVDVVYQVTDEIIEHPEWIVSPSENDPSLLKVILQTSLDALKHVPPQQRFSQDVFNTLLELSLRTVAKSNQVLGLVKWGDGAREVMLLDKALDLVFDFVYNKTPGRGTSRFELVTELLGYSLDTILNANPNKKGLILIQLLLFKDGAIDYSKGFNPTMADQLVESALAILDEHPDLILKEGFLTQTISETAAVLRGTVENRNDLLPEFIRLILEKTAMSAPFFLKTSESGAENILVTAMRQMLIVLTQKEDDEDKWRLGISNAQLLDVFNSITDEIILNPHWLQPAEGRPSVLSIVLSTTFETLKHIPEEQRFSQDTFNWLLDQSLRSVARSNHILDVINWGSGEQEVLVLDKALDLIFFFVYGGPAVGVGGRFELLADLLDYSLTSIMSANPNKKGLMLIQLLLFKDSGIDYSNGFNAELADQLVGSGLAILEEHSELIVRDHFFIKIISDTASVLRTTMIERKHLLPEIIRLILDSSAGHLDLLLRLEENDPKNILVIALEQVLKAVAAKPSVGKWKPALTDSQLLEITDIIFNEIISHPAWTEQQGVFIFDLLNALFLALETIPNIKKLPYEVVRNVIGQSFQAASIKKELILPLHTDTGETQKVVIQYSLEALFVRIYDDGGNETATWNLSQADVLDQLVELLLTAVTHAENNKSSIDDELDAFKIAITNYRNQLIPTVSELLSILSAQEVGA